MTIRMTVDEDLCIGSGDCVRLLPQAFVIDEARGVSVPLPGAGDQDPVSHDHGAGEAEHRLVRGVPADALRPHIRHCLTHSG